MCYKVFRCHFINYLFLLQFIMKTPYGVLRKQFPRLVITHGCLKCMDQVFIVCSKIPSFLPIRDYGHVSSWDKN